MQSQLPLNQSPLNYTGGKFHLLPQILPLFPQKIRRFVDVFCGGCNVGINVNSDEVIFVDSDESLIYLYQTFQHLDKSEILSWIYDTIARYGLSLVSRDGYQHYNCDSSAGLGDFNREPFNRLRADFNCATVFDYRYYITLYVLIVYSFNNQIRFNAAGEFNLPVGKRDFNSRMKDKLVTFIDRIQRRNYQFKCLDFRQLDISSLTGNDFIYADPPYLITRATYNENGGWTDNDERDLLKFLDKVHASGIKFALSNVLSSKGANNHILADWLAWNANSYRAIHLANDYSNSNYHRTDKTSVSDEVLVVNYRPDEGGKLNGYRCCTVKKFHRVR